MKTNVNPNDNGFNQPQTSMNYDASDNAESTTSDSLSLSVDSEDVRGAPYVFPRDYQRFFAEFKYHIHQSNRFESGSKEKAKHTLLAVLALADVYGRKGNYRWMKKDVWTQRAIACLDKTIQLEHELGILSQEKQDVYHQIIYDEHQGISPFSEAKSKLTYFVMHRASSTHLMEDTTTYNRAWQHIHTTRDNERRYPKRRRLLTTTTSYPYP